MGSEHRAEPPRLVLLELPGSLALRGPSAFSPSIWAWPWLVLVPGGCAGPAGPSWAQRCGFMGQKLPVVSPFPRPAGSSVPVSPAPSLPVLLRRAAAAREGTSRGTPRALLQESPGPVIISGKKMLCSDLNADMGL